MSFNCAQEQNLRTCPSLGVLSCLNTNTNSQLPLSTWDGEINPPNKWDIVLEKSLGTSAYCHIFYWIKCQKNPQTKQTKPKMYIFVILFCAGETILIGSWRISTIECDLKKYFLNQFTICNILIWDICFFLCIIQPNLLTIRLFPRVQVNFTWWRFLLIAKALLSVLFPFLQYP